MNKKIYIVIVCVFALGALAGWYLYKTTFNLSSLAPTEYRLNTTPQFKLINPLIFTDSDQRLFTEYDPLDSQLNSYVASAKKDGSVSAVSVYFRDLNTGHWTGIDEDEEYNPSSMMKVTVLISYLRSSLQDNSVLSKAVDYPGEDWTGQNYVEHTGRAAGDYPASDLLNDMIIDSDNSAMTALVKSNLDQFVSTYNDFNLPQPKSDSSDYMTARSYSVVFRSLFNASYLTRSLSNQALDLLTKTKFTAGLVAGVPASTTVAHKFGEHTYVDTANNNALLYHELHDCGIIYYPDHPYLLCVMTKGQDFSKLEKVISTISGKAYQWVDADVKGFQ
jgi:beta-lactamase class A